MEPRVSFGASSSPSRRCCGPRGGRREAQPPAAKIEAGGVGFVDGEAAERQRAKDQLRREQRLRIAMRSDWQELARKDLAFGRHLLVETGPGYDSERARDSIWLERKGVDEAAAAAGFTLVGCWHTHPQGPHGTEASREDREAWRHEIRDVFAHPQLGTPLDPSKLSGYMRKALRAAGIERHVRAWHDLRHTALTHDPASGNPAVYVQARARHAQASMTERYVHAAQVAFPGAADRAEERLFSSLVD